MTDKERLKVMTTAMKFIYFMDTDNPEALKYIITISYDALKKTGNLESKVLKADEEQAND